MNSRKFFLATLALSLSASTLFATPAAGPPSSLESPVGVWKTIDDKTGKASSDVRIYEENGTYFGRIQHVYNAADEASTCDKCKDDRKDKKVVGLVIIRNMKPDNGEYRGGDILDPNTGTIYKCKFRLADQGRRLVVRGFLGFSLIGRSQTWERLQ